MGKFDLGKLDGVLSVGLFGGVTGCFIVYIVCNIVTRIPNSLNETIETASLIGNNTIIIGVIIAIITALFLISNVIRIKTSESEGTPTWHMFVALSFPIITIILSIIIPRLIF